MADMSRLPGDLKKARQQLDRFMHNLPRYIGEEAVEFYKENFDKEGWQGQQFDAWEARKGNSESDRKILTQRGHLRDSIRVHSVDPGRVVIAAGGPAVPYAQIHNEGGQVQIPVTDKSRSYFWRMYYATGKRKWKAMALSQKSEFKADIPQRKFMGASPVLADRVNENVIRPQMRKIF